MNAMRTRCWLQKKIAWLVLCAVLFGAIAPAISHQLAAAAGSTWTEICTATGTQRVALDSGSPQTPKPLLAAEHCPFCLLPNLLPALPTPASLAIFDTAAEDSIPAGAARATPLVHVSRRAHLTRAPPAFS